MTDVYRIGVSIALANGVSPILAVISRDLMGVHTKVGEIEKGFGKWKLAIVGAAAVMGGAGLLGAYSKLIDKGAELVHQQQIMAVSGWTNAEIARATARSWELSAKYKNVGVVDAAKIIGETRLPYGSADTAIKNADSAVAFTSIMKSVLGGEKGRDAASQMFELVRAGEMRNISMDPKKMHDFFDDAAKVTEAFHGKVDPHAYFEFLKYARTNAPYLSERFVTRIAPSLMLEMGNSSAGTALTSFSQAVIGGKMTKRAAGEMVSLGLIDPRSILSTKGTTTQLAKGAVSGWRLAVTDPDLWAQTVLMPAMQKKGITDPLQQRLEFGVVFGNRTAENIANVMGAQYKRLNKDSGLIGQGHGLRGAQEMASGDFNTAKDALHTQWNNFLIAVGSPLVKPATEALKALTGAITSMTKWATANPGKVKVIGEIIVAVGVALIAFGAVAVVAAGIMAVGAAGTVGVVIAVVSAIIGAVGTLIALNWPKVKKAAGDAWDWLKRVGTLVGGFIGGAWGAATKAAEAAFGFIKKAIEIANFVSNPSGAVAGWVMDHMKQQQHAAPPPVRHGASFQHGDVYLDHQKVGRIMYRHQANEMGRPPVSGGAYDPQHQLTPVGAGYSSI